MGDWWDYERSRPLAVSNGLRTRSQRGAIGSTWWSTRFTEVLEDWNDGSRLARGRAYARRGQVIRMDLAAGTVTALVQGTRAAPYTVTINVSVLSDEAWRSVEEAMAGRAIFLARLYAGEMPEEIEETFAAAGASLFPASQGDLFATCTCPDWASPCKHAAAVYYLLAESFDDDPFRIFAWRGRDRDALVRELRALRPPAPGAAEGHAATPAAATLDRRDVSWREFWDGLPALADVQVEREPAVAHDAVLRTLVVSRDGVDDEAARALGRRYERIATAARDRLSPRR